MRSMFFCVCLAWLAISCKSNHNRSLLKGEIQPNLVGLNERFRIIRDDLSRFPNPEDRKSARYFDLTPARQMGLTDLQLQQLREGLTFVVNSLSSGLRVVPPTAIDPQGLIYRISLDDYSWEAQDWERLTAGYPYALRYVQNSSLFPIDASQAEFIRDTTGSKHPIMQADWFINRALDGSKYAEILRLPADMDELQQWLAMNFVDDIQNVNVYRSGFRDSNVSKFNRIIERYWQPGNAGPLWRSYDFDSSEAQKDIFQYPLTLNSDLSKLIFALPNGLQAYFTADAQGKRIDRIPARFMKDSNLDASALKAPAGCMSCHVEKGIIAHEDRIRKSVLNNGAADLDDLNSILDLYPGQDVLTELLTEDQQSYRSALVAAQAGSVNPDTLRQLFTRYAKSLAAADVAAVLGVTSNDLLAAMKANSPTLPSEWLRLKQAGGVLTRDELDRSVTAGAKAIGLGTSL